MLTIGGEAKAVQQIPSLNQTVTAVKVLLGKKDNAAGQLTATLYKGYGNEGKKISTCTVDIASLTTEGDWVTLAFTLPLFKVSAEEDYYLELSAPDSPEASVVWFGTTKCDRYATKKIHGSEEDVAGEASFIALKSNIAFSTNHDQPDGNYMLIHAWVQYVNNAPDTQEDKAFIEVTYPIIAGFADYYIENGYIDEDLKLMRNPNLEHSREGRYWNDYDLITNVFASQALKEMSEIAQARGDKESAGKWMATSKTLAEGIHENLTTEIEGKTIYAELLNADAGNQMIEGFSWVNQAFMAAEWYAMDEEIAANTMELYQLKAPMEYKGTLMLDACYDLKTGASGGHVIGKGFAWDLMYSAKTNDLDRLQYLLDFSVKFSSDTGVYPESWFVDRGLSDVGNQEHCSWQVYAMEYAFPELTKEGKPDDEEDDKGEETNPTGEVTDPDVNPDTSENRLLPLIIGAGIAVLAAAGMWFAIEMKKRMRKKNM